MSKITRPKIWITRTRPSADRSAMAWAEAGFDPVVAPLLTVSKTGDVGPIEPGTALIFTSSNGVRYANMRGDGRPVYAIGKATANAARQAGFTNVNVSGGNWKKLLQIIDKKHENIIHISGRHIRGRIIEALNEAGHKAERRIVYRTNPASEWPLHPAVTEAVALYSPMASETLLDLPERDLSHLNLLCLSDAVAAPFAGASCPVQSISVATEPTEAALIKAALGACSRATNA